MVLDAIKKSVGKLVYGPQENSATPGLPSEALRGLRDKGVVDTKALREIICTDTSYAFLAPYYGMKILDGDLASQQALLARLVDTYAENGTPRAAANIVADFSKKGSKRQNMQLLHHQINCPK